MDSFQKNILNFNNQLGFSGLKESNLDNLKILNPDGIIIAGMGGSGLAGEILNGVQKEINIDLPILIWKNYDLPDNPESRIMENPLYIFVSFSGGTEETISGLKIVMEKNSGNLAVITSGGWMLETAEKNKIPIVSFPAEDLTPRQTAGRMFYAIIKVLQSAGLNPRVSEFKNLNPKNFLSAGKKLASKLRNKIIVIYTDNAHKHLGYIWKIKFNETAKTPAFNNLIPEMNHNEVVGFETKKFKFAAIFLTNKTNPRVEKRFKLNEKLLKNRGLSTFNLKLEGKTELEKTWRTIMLADWTTYFLGKSNKINPEETKIVDELKKLMNK